MRPGELIISGIKGVALDSEEKEFIRDEKIGGIILFKNNYESPAQLAELVNNIQTLRDEYPLFISVDQEGGRVWRFHNGMTVFPSMLQVAQIGSPKIFFEVYQAIALELKACGINLNFAPVCDVLRENTTNGIGDRAYGDSPDEVSKYLSAAIRGLETNDVLSCAKHFPGHGNTTKDSHFGLPRVVTPREEMEEIDIPPFQRAAKSRATFMMMAHLVVDCLDSQLPCSLSPSAYRYLREELKFNRIIITDDMCMGAITQNFGEKEAGLKAILAGADMLIYRDIAASMKVVEELNRAQKTKELKNDLLKEKIERIHRIKKSRFANYAPIYIPEIAKNLQAGVHKQILERVLSKIG